MSSVKGIPFTELIERAQDLGRAGADTKSRLRGIMQSVYTRDIPNAFDWTWLKATSAIGCIAEYNTGYASAITQDGTVSFCSGATLDSSFIGRRIKFDGNPDLYDITALVSQTGCTISPILSGITNAETGGYTIFRNIFSLPENFDRWPVNGGLLFYQAGQPTPVPEKIDDDFFELFSGSPNSQPEACRLIETDSNGCAQFELTPPPSSPYVLRNEYIRALAPMRENSMGTVVMNSNSTAVTGTGTWFTRMATGDYIRATAFGNGPDSDWYRISAIASNSDLTLAKVFRADSNYSGTFVISSMPEMPPPFHEALIYGTMRKYLPDHKDQMWIYSSTEYAKILTNNKVLMQTRHSKDDIDTIASDPEYRR
jgi:hypothetical protein